MEQREKNRLYTALMLLEMAGENFKPEMLGSVEDYAWAAHSYVQAVANGGKPSAEAIDIVRKIAAASGSDTPVST